MPSESQILAQSKSAYNQWCKQWREHAKIHSKFKMKPLSDFENIGVGRAVLCIANGFSFEENLESIKKYQGNVDIMACDKTLGHCLENGITPTYCLVCDANVSYEKYLEPWKDKLQDIVLFSNVCANPEWSKNGNWKDTYFFVNKDILKSEREFSEISGCENQIPAATNVSNAMVVFLTQSDDKGRCNFFGYDKILLIGYDYSWRPDGNYYAFDKTGGGKHNYMRHVYCTNLNNNLCFTSGNLAFSAQWLEKYVRTFNLPVIQCSKETIMSGRFQGDFEKNLRYRFKPEHAQEVRTMIEVKNRHMAEARKLDAVLRKIGRDHYYACMASI